MQEIDIWRSAKIYLNNYGEDAVIHASLRADKLLDQGDYNGSLVWRRVIKVIEELQNLQPTGALN